MAGPPHRRRPVSTSSRAATLNGYSFASSEVKHGAEVATNQLISAASIVHGLHASEAC